VVQGGESTFSAGKKMYLTPSRAYDGPWKLLSPTQKTNEIKAETVSLELFLWVSFYFFIYTHNNLTMSDREFNCK
jgi:hypothetical protein